MRSSIGQRNYALDWTGACRNADWLGCACIGFKPSKSGGSRRGLRSLPAKKGKHSGKKQRSAHTRLCVCFRQPFLLRIHVFPQPNSCCTALSILFTQLRTQKHTQLRLKACELRAASSFCAIRSRHRLRCSCLLAAIPPLEHDRGQSQIERWLLLL